MGSKKGSSEVLLTKFLEMVLGVFQGTSDKSRPRGASLRMASKNGALSLVLGGCMEKHHLPRRRSTLHAEGLLRHGYRLEFAIS